MAIRILARCAIAAALAVPAMATAQGIRPHIPVSTTLGDIAKVRAAYVDAYNDRNAPAVNGMYTADAIVLAADGSETSGGPAISRRNLDSATAWQPATMHSAGVKLYGATAVDVGTWTTQPSGGAAIVQRYLAVFRHGVNGWKLQALALTGSR
ncbi:MAG: nuclear transport factor 2 family protein [Gemmatimonadales bacterium]